MNVEQPAQADWVREILQRHETGLMRYALRITGNMETARDVVQDTFLRLCDADRERIAAYVTPWLYRVCRNRALDVMKKERLMHPTTDIDPERRAARETGPAVSAALAETSALVRAAMAALPDNQQEVFRLKFLDQLSYKEIGEVTGFPVNHVRYLIHTALQAMREQLRGRLDLAGAAQQEVRHVY